MKVLMPYFHRYRRDVWLALLSVIVLVFATLWQPRLLQVVMEAIIKNDQQTVFQQGLYLLGLAVLGIIGGVVNTIYSARVALGVATTYGPTFTRTCSHWPMPTSKNSRRPTWSCG